VKETLTNRDQDGLLRELEDLLRKIRTEHAENLLYSEETIDRLHQLEKMLGCETEADFKAMVEASGDTIATFDEEGRFLYISPNWSKALGHDTSYLLGTSIFEGRFHPEDNPRCQQALKDVFETGERCPAVEYRIQNTKGEWFWHVASLSPIKDKAGKITSVLAVAHDNHTQKLREIQIRNAESRFRTLLDTMQEAVLYVDNNDTMLYVNQSLCEIFGYSREELLGKKGFEMLIVEEDHDIIRNKNREREQGVKDQYEVRGKRKNGEVLRMHVSGAPLRDENGKVIGSVGVLADVTESSRIREALNNSEEKYRSLFENAVVGLLQSTLDDRYIIINPSYARMLGYDSPEEAIASVGDIHEIYQDPTQRDVLKEILLRDGFVENFEAALHNKQGEQIWVLINARLRTNSKGEKVVEGTSVDITSRKHADLERQKLFTIIDGNMSEIYILDPETLAITYANKGAVRNLGYSRDELLKLTPMDICPEMNEQDIRTLLQPLTSGELNSLIFETHQRRKDGSIYPVEIDLQYQEYPGEKLMVAMITDITKSKSLKEQLIASQKMEAVGQLAGGIAHDFNNLLTVILGYGEELLSGLEPDDPLMVSVDEIVKAGRRAAQLTQQLLAFSRKQVAQPRNLNLNTIINNLESMFIRVLGENIKFQATLFDQLDVVFADPGRMEQLITNIVVNARDAMPLGGLIKINTANLTIDETYQDTHAEIAPGDYVILSVSDNGCGMSKEIQQKVYEPFFTTKGVGRGSGLGLSIVYGIVQQSKGHILLYSEEGEGTTFKILLPAVRGEIDVLEDRNPKKTVQGKGESILIVEDEDALRRYVTRMISSLGYKVSSCSSGMEALETIRHGLRPDLIVTDIVMPGINGREMAEQAREIVPGQKVLFVSGFNDDVLVNQGIINADLTYIQKPFSKNDISMKIAEMLNQGSGAENKTKFHILLLDDDEGIRNLYRRSFERKGYLYQASSTVEEALEMLKNQPVDLLLLDMNLGVITGEQALKKIRDEGYLVPVVLLSGLVDPVRVSALRSMGVVQFFEKGFTNQDLYDFIKVMAGAR